MYNDMEGWGMEIRMKMEEIEGRKEGWMKVYYE